MGKGLQRAFAAARATRKPREDMMTRGERFRKWAVANHPKDCADATFSSKDGLYADKRVQAAFEKWMLEGEPEP